MDIDVDSVASSSIIQIIDDEIVHLQPYHNCSLVSPLSTLVTFQIFIGNAFDRNIFTICSSSITSPCGPHQVGMTGTFRTQIRPRLIGGHLRYYDTSCCHIVRRNFDRKILGGASSVHSTRVCSSRMRSSSKSDGDSFNMHSHRPCRAGSLGTRRGANRAPDPNLSAPVTYGARLFENLTILWDRTVTIVRLSVRNPGDEDCEKMNCLNGM
jgi:hypothetical protein